MKIAYQNTAAEFSEAYGTIWQRPSRRLLRYVGMVVGSFLLLIVAWRVRHSWRIELFDVTTFLLGIFWLRLQSFLGFYVRQHFSKHPNLHGPFQVEINEDGIRFVSANATWDFRWTAYTKALETKNLFVLYQGDCTFSFLPKQAFAPDQVLDFRSLVQAKIPLK